MNKKNSILLLSLLLVSCNQAQVDNPSNNDLSESVASESSLIMPSIEISNSEDSIEPTINPTQIQYLLKLFLLIYLMKEVLFC